MAMPEFLEKKYVGPVKGWHIVAGALAVIGIYMWKHKSSSNSSANPASTCPPGSTMDPTGTFCIPDSSQGVGGGIPIGDNYGSNLPPTTPSAPTTPSTPVPVTPPVSPPTPTMPTLPAPVAAVTQAVAQALPQGFTPAPLALTQTGNVQQATYYNSVPAPGYAPATMNVDLIQRLAATGMTPDQIAAFGGLTPGAHSSLNGGYQPSTIPSYGGGHQYPQTTPYAPAFLQGA